MTAMEKEMKGGGRNVGRFEGWEEDGAEEGKSRSLRCGRDDSDTEKNDGRGERKRTGTMYRAPTRDKRRSGVEGGLDVGGALAVEAGGGGGLRRGRGERRAGGRGGLSEKEG